MSNNAKLHQKHLCVCVCWGMLHCTKRQYKQQQWASICRTVYTQQTWHARLQWRHQGWCHLVRLFMSSSSKVMSFFSHRHHSYLRWAAWWVLCPFWQPAMHVNFCIEWSFVPIWVANKVISLSAFQVIVCLVFFVNSAAKKLLSPGYHPLGWCHPGQYPRLP